MTAPSRPSHEEIPLNLYRVSAPGIARVAANLRLTPPGHDEVRHITLDLSGLDYRYLEGQSLGCYPRVSMTGGVPNKLRLYSIASAGWATTVTAQARRSVSSEWSSRKSPPTISTGGLPPITCAT